MSSNQRALDTAVWAGIILLENGAEIGRVHGTVVHFLESFGIKDHNVYVISNGIFASACEQSDNPCHVVRQVAIGGTHMGRISAVNELSREVERRAESPMGIDEIRRRLGECAAVPPSPVWALLLACAIGCAGFCYIMGGSAWDAVSAFIAGFALQCFLHFAARTKLNRFITNIVGGAWVTLLGRLLFLAGIGSSFDRVIIGAIIPLVPGVLLTTAIRDFFNSDYVSGTIHLIDALLIAACIAVGVGGMLGLWSLILGVGM